MQEKFSEFFILSVVQASYCRSLDMSIIPATNAWTVFITNELNASVHSISGVLNACAHRHTSHILVLPLPLTQHTIMYLYSVAVSACRSPDRI